MIDLLPNDEQQALLDNIASVLAAEAPVARGHASGGDASLIAALAGLGWIGLGLEEAEGGVGFGVAEELLLMREAGRHLVGPGLIAALLAARAAAKAGQDALAAALIAGERPTCLLVARGGGFLRLDHVPGAVMLAIDANGARLFGDSAVRSAEAVAGIDPVVALEIVTLDDSAALLTLSAQSDPLPLRATLLMSAMLVGMAEASRDMAVAYAKLREQFGQPIGSFQAIKHRCADMAVRCEAAWSLTVLAGLGLAEGRADSAFQISAARLLAGDAAGANAAANVQVHGGMGFTEECDAQLYVKRTRLWLVASGLDRSHAAALMAEPEPMRGLR